MVMPAVPNLPQLEEVIPTCGNIMKAGPETVAHAVGPEKDPVWILHHVKFDTSERIPDMFREAGAHQQQFLAVPDRVGKRRDG
jgi:hypothetical protein